MELMLLLLKKPMNVTELAKRSCFEQSAVSHHLKRLKLCEFVKMRKNGKEHVYSVNEETARSPLPPYGQAREEVLL